MQSQKQNNITNITIDKWGSCKKHNAQWPIINEEADKNCPVCLMEQVNEKSIRGRVNQRKQLFGSLSDIVYLP